MVSLGLEGKVILVTGGNKGIGASMVGLLEDLGAKVAYTYRNGEGERGSLPIQVDVRDSDAMKAAAEKVEKELGPIYGVVANAGITKDGLFVKGGVDDWDEVIATNLNGVYYTVRPIMPLMNSRNEGSIVLISSIVGERGNIGQANYAAAKAGLIGLAKTLAREGARFSVRANVVAPGFIETDMLKPIPDKVKDKIIEEIPARRFGKPEEIAWGTAFLLSPRAGYITGEVLRVNGGHLM